MAVTEREFRFGFTLSTTNSGSTFRDAVRNVERLGYDILTVPDHLPGRLATTPTLMAAASATSSLHVASSVYCNDLRHPVLLYHDAATINLLSGGRMVLGMGAGWMPEDYTQTGIPFDPPNVRVDRLEEAIQVIVACRSGKTVDFHGLHYHLDGYKAPLELANIHLPLFVGGGGKRLLSLGAKFADTVGICPRALPQGGLDLADITWESVERKSKWISQAAETANRDPERNMLIFDVFVSDARTSGPAAELDVDSPHLLYGTISEITDKLYRLRDEFAISSFTINTGDSRHLMPFSEVIAALRTRS